MQTSPEEAAKALVLYATENTEGLPVLSLVPCEGPDLPGMPTCVHTDREQELAQFPGKSTDSVTSVVLTVIQLPI